jgi:hypothetical protein
MRKMREKIGAADNISLISWAKRRIKGADRRINGQKHMHAPRESERLPKNQLAGAGPKAVTARAASGALTKENG